MTILAFDTATTATTVALMGDVSDEPVVGRDDPAPDERPRHTTRLMSMIADVMDRAGCGWGEIDRLAAGVGPGTFTGLRIGLATARALARARQIPLVGVSTLQSLALGADAAAVREGHGAVLAVLDARRGEVFAAAWMAGRVDDPPVLEPLAIAPDALAKKLPSLQTSVLVVGDGALAFREVLDVRGTTIPESRSRVHLVEATFHCQLASGRAPVADRAVLPEYLRLPDAELAQQGAGKP